MTKSNQSNHSGIGGELILVGGILALIFPIFPLVLAIMLRNVLGEWFEQIGTWLVGRGSQSGMIIPQLATSIMFFIAIGAIATILFGAVAVTAYAWVRRGKLREGGMVAIMASVAMLASLHWIPGILIMIGGILCYRAGKSPVEKND